MRHPRHTGSDTPSRESSYSVACLSQTSRICSATMKTPYERTMRAGYPNARPG
jgi:hypothetical protein